MRTWPLTILVALLALVLVAGCTTEDEGDQTADQTDESGEEDETDDGDDEDADDGDRAERVRVAISQDEGTLTPYTYVSGSGWLFLHMVYDSLLMFDEQNEPQPLLATEVDISDDRLTYTLPLRDDVTWHDGEPFTAEDVAFSFNYAVENQHSRWTPAMGALGDIEATGDHEVEITLEEPDASFQLRPLADMPIFPAHVWEGIDEPEAAEIADATGTGPYELVEYESDQSYRLEANDDYFLGEPKVGTLDISVIPERSTAFSALRAGEIDVAFESLEPQLVEEFEERPEISLAQGAGFRSEILQFNTEHPLLDDARVRRAIGHAIDVDELVEVVLLGFGTPGTAGYAHPDSPLAVDPIEHEFDPDRARELLDEAGFTGGDDDGRTRDGAPLSLTLIGDAADPIRVRSAELIRDMLAEVGVEVTVETMERASVTDRVWPDFDVSQGRDFDMAMFGWSPPVMLDPSRLGSLVHSDPSIGSINIGGLESEELDSLVDEFNAATDPDERDELSQQIQEGIAEERPFVTLFYPDLIYAYDPEVYDDWVFQDGQGIIQKLSFIPE